MSRVYIMVEGQTEEAFIREVMLDIYSAKGIYLTAIVIETSRGHKGGVPSFAKVKPQIENMCKHDKGAYVTTLFDYYAIPTDFPGYAELAGIANAPAVTKVHHLEQHMGAAIQNARFIPNLMLHEFEALLLTDVEAFAEWTDNDAVLAPLRAVRATTAPEDINNSVHTAPSKRILSAMKGYQKTFHGPLIAHAIGLDAMRAACPHFHAWLTKLDALKGI